MSDFLISLLTMPPDVRDAIFKDAKLTKKQREAMESTLAELAGEIVWSGNPTTVTGIGANEDKWLK